MFGLFSLLRICEINNKLPECPDSFVFIRIGRTWWRCTTLWWTLRRISCLVSEGYAAIKSTPRMRKSVCVMCVCANTIIIAKLFWKKYIQSVAMLYIKLRAIDDQRTAQGFFLGPTAESSFRRRSLPKLRQAQYIAGSHGRTNGGVFCGLIVGKDLNAAWTSIRCVRCKVEEISSAQTPMCVGFESWFILWVDQ